MRGYDAVLIGSALIVLPLLGWITGRFGGRRNWGVTRLLLTSAIMSVVAVAAVFFLPAVLGYGPGGDFLSGRIMPIWPELPAFLLSFGMFVSLVVWAGTPASMSR